MARTWRARRHGALSRLVAGECVADLLQPLSELQEGSTAEVCSIARGWGASLRLHEMGISPGAPIKIIRNIRGGPKIIEVRGFRVTLGDRVAGRVMVRPIVKD